MNRNAMLPRGGPTKANNGSETPPITNDPPLTDGRGWRPVHALWGLLFATGLAAGFLVSDAIRLVLPYLLVVLVVAVLVETQVGLLTYRKKGWKFEKSPWLRILFWNLVEFAIAFSGVGLGLVLAGGR